MTELSDHSSPHYVSTLLSQTTTTHQIHACFQSQQLFSIVQVSLSIPSPRCSRRWLQEQWSVGIHDVFVWPSHAVGMSQSSIAKKQCLAHRGWQLEGASSHLWETHEGCFGWPALACLADKHLPPSGHSPRSRRLHPRLRNFLHRTVCTNYFFESRKLSMFFLRKEAF